MDKGEADKLKADAKAEAAAESSKRLADLKAAFPDDPAFVLAQHELGHTVIEAKAAFCDVQAARIKEQDAALSARDKEVEALKAKGRTTGVDPLSESAPGGKSASFDGDPIAAWNTALQAKVTVGMDKSRATSALVREQPDLHAAYLEAYNELHPPARGRRRK